MYSTIGCAGYGNMGRAFLLAIHQRYPGTRLVVLEKVAEKAQDAEREIGARVVDSLEALIEGVEALILAIKPQDAGPLLDRVKALGRPVHLLSILGGKTIPWIQERSGTRLVARFMPSLAASTGSGAVALCLPPDAPSDLSASAEAVAATVGTVYPIPESLMGAFTGISGSGIAFVWQMVHGMAMGGVKNGIPYAQGVAMVADVLMGAALTLKQEGEHPMSLVSRVCSPGGTTVEGILALEEAGLSAALMDAVTRVAEKSRALE